MPNLSGALKPSGHQLKKKKTKNKSRDSQSECSPITLCSQCTNKIGHCCDNKLSVIETADKFKMC